MDNKYFQEPTKKWSKETLKNCKCFGMLFDNIQKQEYHSSTVSDAL